MSRAIEALGGVAKHAGLKKSLTIQAMTSVTLKRDVSAASRRRMALAQEKRWAAIKAAEK